MVNLNKVLIGGFLKRIRRPVDIEKDKEYKLLTVKLHHKGIVLRCVKKGSEIGAKKMYTVKTGDFILSGIDARNGAFGIVPEEMDGAVVTNDFWYFNVDANVIDKRLFLELTQTSWFDEICRKGSDGTTQRIRLQKEKFYNQEIQLPLKANHDTLLNKIFSVKTCNKSLYTEITHQQSLLKKLRQSVLQGAIAGKLTEKWRKENHDDEPATGLLEQINSEKEQLVKEKKIKKPKPLPPITKDEIPFELPEGWVWCRLGKCSFNHDGERVPVSLAQRQRRKKIYDYYGASGVIDKIDSYTYDGTYLLIGEDGANLVARTTPIAFIVKGKFWVNNHAHVLSFSSEALLKYIEFHINAINLKPYVTGGFQPKLSQNNLNGIILAIPTEDECNAIVTKVEKLFAYCDELEQQISKSQQNSEHLMQAVLKEVFKVKTMS